MPRKYSVEFKEKTVHQVTEMVRLESCSLQRAYMQIGELLGVSHHTLRTWYRDSASVRDISDASGGETMEEERGASAPRKSRTETRKRDCQDCLGFFRSGTRPTLRPHDLLHRRAQRSMWGRGHLQSPETSRSWIHHLTRLSQSHHTCSQCEGFK